MMWWRGYFAGLGARLDIVIYGVGIFGRRQRLLDIRWRKAPREIRIGNGDDWERYCDGFYVGTGER